MEILADKIRPTSLSEIIGQEHLTAPGKVIYNLIKNKHLFSMILYGTPGTGKTTIAKVIAKETSKPTAFLNAVNNKKEDFELAINDFKLNGDGVLIIDEIHRMNKDKQDMLLPYVESGLVILIGLTSSNPYLKVNPAIRSRCTIFQLHELTEDSILKGLKKAIIFLKDIQIDEECLKYIAKIAGGDMRFALNLLEVSYYSSDNFKITMNHLEEIAQKPNIFIDENGDGHFDMLSALQKSIRGSDPDAAVYYVARLLSAGDLDSIERRLAVIAYEDIGLANPGIGPRVDSAINNAERVGLPEAGLILANIAVEMALSPKSNSTYIALAKAQEDINLGLAGNIPSHIKNGSPNYKYPHNYENSYIVQTYLPDNIKDHKYYIAKNNLIENNLNKVHRERMNKK